ncbi:MAG: hypothetical protein PHR77_00095 [Kiritimatiellae bacterium]|nr:hypothetical protein [Kiritimatiellia bacterium]MDD5519228.1 hypothetical protein [Kiritimatiellia bacterium]
MRVLKHLIMVVVLAAIIVVGAGCGSLSLFSSRHVHYHASPEADKKIDTLEKRVEILEKAVQEQKK